MKMLMIVTVQDEEVAITDISSVISWSVDSPNSSITWALVLILKNMIATDFVHFTRISNLPALLCYQDKRLIMMLNSE